MKVATIFKDTLIYGITNYLAVFASLFLTPMYTRYFLKSEYGVMEIFNTWSSFALILIPLGLSGSMLRFYEDVKKDSVALKKTIGTSLFHLLFQAILYVICMLFFKNTFFKIFNINPSYYPVYYMSILIVILQSFISYFMSLLRVQFEKKKYLIVSIVNLFLLNFFGVILVLVFKLRVESFFIAALISSIISLMFLLYFTKSNLYFKFDSQTSKILLGYSIHLLSASLLFQITNLLDRYIISNYDPNLNQMGLFSIALKLGTMVNIVVSAFSLAWFPHAMKIMNQQDAPQIYSNFHDIYILVMSTIISVFFIFRKEVLYIMAPGYMETYFLIPIVAVYIYILGFAYFYSLGIHIMKKTNNFTYLALITITINALLSLYLVNKIGLYGVLLGTLFAYVFWMASQLFISQKLFKINFNYKMLLIPFFLFTSILFIVNWIDNNCVSIEVWLFKIILSLAVVGLIFLLTPKSIKTELFDLLKKYRKYNIKTFF